MLIRSNTLRYYRLEASVGHLVVSVRLLPLLLLLLLDPSCNDLQSNLRLGFSRRATRIRLARDKPEH